MAAAILSTRAAAEGVAMHVTSAGTAAWHTGRPAHPLTQAELATQGMRFPHSARTFTGAQFADLDLVLAMDRANLADLTALAQGASERAKIHLIRDFDPSGPAGREVPDPYSGGPEDYRRVFDMLDAACRGLLARIASAGPPPWAAQHPAAR